MPFSKNIREDALVKAHRHCCVCHEFAGRSINVHHIKPECDSGDNSPDNAVALCLRCHAEAGHFNSRHSIGTKYSPRELKRHRDEWWAACANGTARLSSVSITPKIDRIRTSSDLHTYRLILSLRNGNKDVISDWNLDIYLPSQFEVSTEGVGESTDAEVANLRYQKFHIDSHKRLLLGQEHQLTNERLPRLEYNVNSDIFYKARDGKFKIMWHFYSDVEPAIQDEILWEEMQQY
jgi:hypothetical protein